MSAHTIKRTLTAICAASALLLTFSCRQDNPDPFIDGHEYVDLGLPSGTLWATCNLGASKPEESGDYYGWGMTEPYKATDEACWPTYFSKIGGSGTSKADCGTDADPLKDYAFGGSRFSQAAAAGVSDGIGGTGWDAVRQSWKGNWRMPTVEEFKELRNPENCISEWTTLNGVKGKRYTSKTNGKSIFLPVTGSLEGKDVNLENDGVYWTSTPYNYDPSTAHILDVFSLTESWVFDNRYGGEALRPVIKK